MSTKTLVHFWGGSAQPGSGQFFDRHNPSNGDLITRVPDASEAEVNAVVAAARQSFDKGPWRHFSGIERAKFINALADEIEKNGEEIAIDESKETGKPISLSRGDVKNSVNLFRYAASHAMQMHGDVHTNLGKGFTGLVTRVPVGVAALITPWNFPLLLLAQKLPFAIAAGCTAILKPSEFTSTTTVMVAEMATKVGIPDGVVNVILGYGDTAGQRLIEHPDIDFISFTGSTRTGRAVIDASKIHLKRTSMELGGKSANIVFADADIDDAIDGVMFGVLFNNGECCVSGSRLLVEEKIADEFVTKLSRRMSQIRLGDSLAADSQLGPMIHKGHLESVINHVSKAVSQGAVIATGGVQISEGSLSNGHFVAPTVVDKVTEKHDIFHNEVFGPVLAVVRFKSKEEALRIANGTKYGLAASVWSKNLDTALEMSSELIAGTVWINTTIDGAPQLPGGGVKESGFGREMGKAGFDEFTEVKTIQIRTGARERYFK